MRIGIGHDTHRLVEGRPLILGGVVIPFERGLYGHSDADVVLHALADALLGAAALGDIGELFPDTDPQNKDLASTEIVREVLRRVRQAGWQPVNVDITVHAEQPKLGPHKLAIGSRIAQLLAVHETAVSVKAKTGERVGPIGRGEAISCDAAVLLSKQG